MENNSGTEKSHLIHEKTAKMYSLKLQSSFPDSKQEVSDFSFSNGLELRPVRSHCHRHVPRSADAADKIQARNKLMIASAVCLVFMIGEVIGGYLAHSLAIMTDAAHLLTDLGSMMVSLFSLWLSSRPPSKTLTWGWHRSGAGSPPLGRVHLGGDRAALLYLAVERIVQNDYHINGNVMLVTSLCAVMVNIIMAYILHHSTSFHAHGSGYHQIEEDSQSPAPSHTGHAPTHTGHAPSHTGHAHSHTGHAHSLLSPHGNTSVRAAFIHVLGDLLQSVGVLVAALIIYLRPEYKVADPICTFLFSAFVLCTTITILRDVIRILMEGCPKEIQFRSVKEVLLSVTAVKSVHSLNLWSLSAGHSLVSVHLAIDPGADSDSVLVEATDLLHDKFGFSSSTVQVEKFTSDMQQCTDCQDPLD
uniref:Probable proton-coupled zinc antiporter SLC30A3 n=1 Tax=Knipowitschia caucasica TaxID=637954 RepID=A0AAV2KBH5_KNICA